MTTPLIAQFTRWLERFGAQLKPTTNEWEVVRWSPANGSATHVMYLKKNKQESFSSDAARQHWLQFLEDEEDDGETLAKPSARPELKAPASTTLQVMAPRTVGSYTGADVHDEKGRWIATIHGTNGKYEPIDSFEANCHLIGAAPQMLAELKATLQYLYDYHCQDPDAAKPVLGIQQAIDLATKGPQ